MSVWGSSWEKCWGSFLTSLHLSLMNLILSLFLGSVLLLEYILHGFGFVTPNMDFTLLVTAARKKRKTENKPSQTERSDVHVSGPEQKQPPQQEFWVKIGLEGMRTQIGEKWLSSIMVTGSGCPPLTFRKGRRSKIGIMLFFLILLFFLPCNQLELTMFNFLLWSQFLTLIKSNLSMYLFYGPCFWSCI